MVAMGINVSANTAGTGSMKLLDVGLTAREFTLYIYIEMGRPMIWSHVNAKSRLCLRRMLNISNNPASSTAVRSLLPRTINLIPTTKPASVAIASNGCTRPAFCAILPIRWAVVADRSLILTVSYNQPTRRLFSSSITLMSLYTSYTTHTKSGTTPQKQRNRPSTKLEVLLFTVQPSPETTHGL